MLDKMKQLYQLQKKAKEIQKELKETEIEARSTDGEVTVVYNGEQHLVDIAIAEDMLSPQKKKELEQLIIKVSGEAMSKAQALAAEKTKDVMKDMGMNIPGM
ncbi:nucleoid-associated protein, YbaB/EbfC family [Candidatus Berkelbacteria bacterium CG06_land_8_20_14_3_00_43_10]|uniref:Nucleoid-associated protein, YbaB/EbfC family n=1 Tax=Candidatus Berkelbacteria bacterium CG10_big_fil_rev_8_21_14_0_10_43_14 TaxID=1974515 RepID=A0A2M6R9G3_9BACT|nr:MAG: nucleoid-associated protein, YbaB/EbfC family [Candidatus Berkelbacteria bacterium CG10_big_fil_rev_8_21_14_0_10_43_14]PIU87181.1 MAG: nucleoid-associated protein, YbaB/EbfC family [Candidatus Berkelbacteria bacterium CG06_land_8_20_14_3_00_43_10]